MKEKKGPPKEDYNSPWRLHIGIFWKLHFITSSPGAHLAERIGRNNMRDFFWIEIKLLMEFVFLEGP